MAAKFGGAAGGAALGGAVSGVGCGVADACCRWWWLPAEEVSPTCAPLGFGPGPRFSWVMTSRGTVAITAMTAAAVAAATAALVTLRRRARFLISSKVPGGGGSGWIWARIQLSSSSRGSAI